MPPRRSKRRRDVPVPPPPAAAAGAAADAADDADAAADASSARRPPSDAVDASGSGSGTGAGVDGPVGGGEAVVGAGVGVGATAARAREEEEGEEEGVVADAEAGLVAGSSGPSSSGGAGAGAGAGGDKKASKKKAKAKKARQQQKQQQQQQAAGVAIGSTAPAPVAAAGGKKKKKPEQKRRPPDDAAPSSSSSIHDDDLPLLTRLVLEVTSLSSSRIRCAVALRALAEGRTAYAVVAGSAAEEAHRRSTTPGKNDDGTNDDDDDGRGGYGYGNFAPDLASMAAAVHGGAAGGGVGMGEDALKSSPFDFGGIGDAVAAAAATAAPSSSGGASKSKKREKKKKGGGNNKDSSSSKEGGAKGGNNKKDSSSKDKDGTDGGGGGAADDQDDARRGTRDAHLIMAATHAINVLLASLRRTTADGNGDDGDDDDDDDGDGDGDSDPNKRRRRNVAMALVALSRPLLASLANDRAALEGVTRASRSVAASASAASASSSAASSSAASSSAHHHHGGHHPSLAGGSPSHHHHHAGGYNNNVATAGTLSVFSAADADDDGGDPTTTMARSSLPGGGSSSSPAAGGSSPSATAASAAARRRTLATHARAAVGRALASGVMGALWGLEEIVGGAFQGRGGNDGEEGGDAAMGGDPDGGEGMAGGGDEDEGEEGAGAGAEAAVLRGCLWSALTALETAFQLAPRPRLLATSAVASSSSLSSSSTAGAGASSAGGPTTMDFDRLLSVAAIGMGVPPSSAPGVGGGGGGVGEGGTSGAGGARSARPAPAGSDDAAAAVAWGALLRRVLADHGAELPPRGGPEGGEEDGHGHLALVCREATGAAFPEGGDDRALIMLALGDGGGGDAMAAGDGGGDGSGNEPPAKRRRRAAGSGKAKKGTRPSSGGRGNGGDAEGGGDDHSRLSALLSSRPENRVSFDCHVSVRRWAVLAFGWLCRGQKRLLETCASMLADDSRRKAWEGVMALPEGSSVADSSSMAESGASAATAMTSLSKKKKKKKDSKGIKLPSSEDSAAIRPDLSLEPVKGNLALVTFVCCVVDTVHDAGAAGGLSPPSSGWMDEYVRAVAGDLLEAAAPAGTDGAIPAAAVAAATVAAAAVKAAPAEGGVPVRRSSRKRSRSSKAGRGDPRTRVAAASSTPGPPRGSPRGSGNKSGPPGGSGGGNGNCTWARPDFRDEAAILTKTLVEAHVTCLKDNFGEGTPLMPGDDAGGGGLLLVYDDGRPCLPAASPRAGRQRGADRAAAAIEHYYPFMHRTLDTLGRAAASSAPSVAPGSLDGCRSRILAIGSAVALGCLGRGLKGRRLRDDDGFDDVGRLDGPAIVYDAKLLSLALMQLSDCLECTILSGSAGGGDGLRSAIAAATAAAGVAQTPDNVIPNGVVATYRLDNPLDISPESARQAMAERPPPCDSGFSSYGGAFLHLSQDDRISNVGETRSFRGSLSSSWGRPGLAEVLSLFVRAQASAPGAGGDHSSSMASLLNSLLGIVCACYRFGPETHSTGGGGGDSDSFARHQTTTDPTSAGRKKGSKKKKRRANEIAPSVLEEASSNATEFQPRKTSTRCILAADALDALVKLLSHAPAWSASSLTGSDLSASMSIRSYFRRCLPIESVLDFVGLGHRLVKNLVSPRLELTEQESSTATSVDNAASLRDKSENVFDPWERRLWASHVRLALTVGRGHTASVAPGRRELLRKSRNNDIVPVLPCLDGSEARLRVLRTIVAVEEEKGGRIGGGHHQKQTQLGLEGQLARRNQKSKTATKNPDDDSQAELWPFCLPAVHHALAASLVLSCDDPPSADVMVLDVDDHEEQSSRVELLFMCNSFLNSIEELFGDLFQVSDSTSGGKMSLPLATHEDVPISLCDARMFALAVARLGRRADQRGMLTRCISILHSGLVQQQTAPPEESLLTISCYASHFVARAITLCAALVDIVLSPGLGPALAAELESTNYDIPSLRRVLATTTEQSINSKEIYQGLFADWQSPSVPAADISSTEMLEEGDYLKFEAVIRSSLDLGFRTSSYDGCHLLFSSWNTAAKLSSWSSHSWEGPASSTVLTKVLPIDRIMRLREDMCEINDLMMGAKVSHSRHSPDTLLMKVVRSKAPLCQPIVSLLSGLNSAEKELVFLTLEISAETPTPTLATLAYCEALPLYTSFLISMLTYPGDNDMGHAHRLAAQKSSRFSSKHRRLAAAYETLSEDSELETDNAGTGVARANALTRLHDACLVVGAAPCFPDWLDVGCGMREGIDLSVAVDSSCRALTSLTQFGAAAFKCYSQAIQQALDMVREDLMQGEETPAASAMVLQLFSMQQQLPSGVAELFYAQLSALCHIDDSSIFKVLADSISSQYCLAGRALVTNSAQRIKGADVSRAWNVLPGEHRANGQWETLLSESLQGSSLSVPHTTIAYMDGSNSDASKRIADALVAIHHWRRILYSVVNAMIPTTALLRFSAGGGKGRNTHSLCEDRLPGSVFSSSDSHEAAGSSPSRFSTKDEVIITMNKALCFLTCVSVYSSNDEAMGLATKAAAGHLLENSAHFSDLTSLWAARNSFEAIDRVVRALADDENLTESQQTSACSIIETLLTHFADAAGDEFDGTSQPIITLDDSLDRERRTTLLACLGLENLKVGRLIGGRSDLELTSMLDTCDRTVPFGNEGWGSMQREFTKLLLTLMCMGRVQLHIRARVFVAEMLLDLMDAELEILSESGDNENVCLSAAVSLDAMSKDDVLLIVENLSNSSRAEDGVEEEHTLLSEKTARVISHIASASWREVSGDGCRIILHEMLGRLNQWAGMPSQQHMISLLCLLSSRFGALDEAGSKIVSLLQSEQDASMYMEAAKIFFEFVASLDQLVNRRSTGLPQVSSTPTRAPETPASQGACITLKNGEEVSRTCSFVETGEGFTEQHWYNCYTCGLLWDKGCCSLCARVCHKGHDVGYSRKSSFFCDCGAEVATAIEQNRTSCKCLTPVSEEVIRDLYEAESDADESETAQDAQKDYFIFSEFVARNFPSECKISLQKLVEEAKSAEWRESLMLKFNQCYATAPSLSATDFATLFSDTAPQPSRGGSANLKLRSAEPLALKRQYETSMVPIRAAKASALQPRMISSSSTSHIRKARSDLAVQIIAADNRGRLFIAESSLVLFCNAIPSVNVRHMDNSPASHLSRTQLNILGSDNIKFPINGMAICPENNRHLLVWGVSKACVAIVSKNFDSFERVIELKLNLDSSECESEYLVKCDWMPQSELQVVCCCGTVVHVFDLKRTESNSCNATTHYALAYEDVLIRSATLIGSLSVDDGSAIETKLVLLLDTGRLYFISLTIDEEGNLEDHGESYIEIGSGVSFPSAGIRRYCGTECAPEGSTATTFGEGVYLAYLRQSNLLLYQCVSSCCIAFFLDDDGAICGSFELLPNMISADVVGGHCGVAGPYTHFQELGTVRRGTETFFKVTCVGRSTRSTQPRVLVLEFNESSVSVKELSWPTNCSAGLGFISSYNFVGSCTFSVPFLLGGHAAEGSIKDSTQVYERAILTLLSSSGSLLWYAEDCGHNISARDFTTHVVPHSSHYHHRALEIGIFEKMINVSEMDGLVFGGDFVGKDPKAIKKKLSLNNTDYVISPSRDGCTLTVGLQVNSSKCNPDTKHELEDNALSIVAVRVLVGSMPDLIPREIAIMGSGRSIKLKKNTKRWYDFALTDEETLLAIRNGFVTIWISPCHESSSTPIIDSVEVYARKRKDLSFLTSDLVGCTRGDNAFSKPTQSYCIQEQPSSETLLSCIESLTFLTQIMGHNEMGSLSEGSKETISHIIQQTALDSGEKGTLRDQTIGFLSEAMSGDTANRSYLIDEATLRGLMSALQGLGQYLRSDFANVDIVSSKQEAMIDCTVDMLIHIITSTISIARMRGGNYRKALSVMIEEQACQVSMALEGKKILDFCQYLKALHGANLALAQPAQLVSELILMEVACSDSENFAQFDTLAEYLLVDSTEIVKACCLAISSVTGVVEGSKISSNNSSPEKELAYVTYQCDACLVFPITERRYTLGGDEMDIDLCMQCYDRGIAYARSHDQNDPVIINGRTLCVENDDMTCGKIWQMTSKPIAPSSLEQAENAKKAGLLNRAKDAALKMGSESNSISMDTSSSRKGDGIEVVKTEGFRSQIFTKLIGLMTKSLDVTRKEDTSPPSNHVLQLVINLVLDSCTEELKCARGKEMALAFSKNIPSLVNACKTNESLFSQNSGKLVVTMRALAGLVLQKRDISRGPPLVSASEEDRDGLHAPHHNHHHHHKDKTDPRFICEVHGVPAVRRRCSHGPHKDRRFYVCGLERKHRCHYFKWANGSDNPELVPDSNGKFQVEYQLTGRDDHQDIFVSVQKELQHLFSEKALQEQFCSLIGSQFEKNQTISTAPEVALVNEGTPGNFSSLKNECEKMQDIDDGVYRTLEKFGKSKPVPSQLKDDESMSSSTADGSKDSFLCSSLDIFSLLVPKRKTSSDVSDSSAWSSEWFSILCEIISTSPSHMLRHLAKTMLQRLCGGRQEIYHRVRDHYVFGFQFRKLLQRSQDILDAALVVREQARQCGPDWRDEEVVFASLPASGLLGVEDLISENWYSISTEANITAVLDELLSAAVRGVGVTTKTRSNNWRQFCGLPEMAISSRTGTSAGNAAMLEMLEEMYHRPPIVCLLWLISCLRGPNQVKALTLTDIALEDLNASTRNSTAKSKGEAAEHIGLDEDEILVGGYQRSDNHPSDPEETLLKCFTVDDLLAFIEQFVLNGRSNELQLVSSSVAKKLALRFPSSDKHRLFAGLIGGPFKKLGALGSASSNFSDLLRTIVETFGSELDLSTSSSSIALAFMNQMTHLNYYCGPSQRLPGKSENDSGSCDLADCVHCHKQVLPKKATKTSNKKSENSFQGNTSKDSDGSKPNFLSEQVRPYQRGRLEASTAASVSSEFSSYNQLKFRLALSQVHVTVTDPRGRLVKTIGVYFSPRQVSDTNVLKSEKYNHIWQRCGTLSLSRGASEATCKLKTPVIAANLKFTYEQFYEKSSNKRAPDGSFILYCPRCTRQVHNAHGVCGNCGEVAFQCRKCRHINYDRLDAFLCVECGYCTAGGFSYELTAGIALNAIAILDEDGFQRSMAMLRIAKKRQLDMRNNLKKKVMVAMQQQRKLKGDHIENLDEMVLYGPQLKRALFGGMPKSDGFDDDHESSKKPSGSSRSSSSLNERVSSTSSRARSLLSLARSLRAEGGDGLGSRGDFLRQALLGAGSSGASGFDPLDDADLISALAGAGTSSSSDPLSRIVANMHARARDEGRSSRAGASGAGGGGGGGGKAETNNSRKDDKSKLSSSEERHRVYTQMREAERECYELNRRIDAWGRLNKDCLVGFRPRAYFAAKSFTFLPSTCSACSPQLAYQILSLLHSVYLTNIAQSEHTVTADLIKNLLKESEHLSMRLKDLKRQVIITLASTSEVASKIILTELKSRLVAVQDVTSAEILGKLVQLDFPSVDDYIELAMTTLSNMQ